MSKQTRNFILSLYVIALILLVMGATYAYFTVIKVSTYSPKIDATTATTNYISFNAGKSIFINPNQYNFKENMDNLTDTTTTTAYLLHSEGDNTTTYHYNIYLEIEKNELSYSTTDNTAELILQVIDPKGKELKSIQGLNYVTVTDGTGKRVSGFDVTDKEGKFFIAQSYEITTKTEAKHIWNTTLTFVNLGTSQNENLGKVLKGYIKIEKVWFYEFRKKVISISKRINRWLSS